MWFGSDGAVYVRRRPGEALQDNCTRKTVKHGGGNVMVWGAMSAQEIMEIDQHIGILQNVRLPSLQDMRLEEAGFVRARH